MSGTTTLVWFRRDLRLADNPALAAAVADSDHVVAVYVHAPDEESPVVAGCRDALVAAPQPGGARCGTAPERRCTHPAPRSRAVRPGRTGA